MKNKDDDFMKQIHNAKEIYAEVMALMSIINGDLSGDCDFHEALKPYELALRKDTNNELDNIGRMLTDIREVIYAKDISA